MCGIIGYIGNKKAAPVLIRGLKKLEYRGYDSYGLCTIKNKKLQISKKAGKISDAPAIINTNFLSGNIGIGHTRWATHGKPSIKNSHPHTDCQDRFAIVHNGIIENYQGLKEILKKENHHIKSDTDSEIIVHLIEKFYQGDLEKAVQKTLGCIDGAYGLAIIDSHDKEKIVIAKRGSPIIIGVGNNEMFVASDVPAILEYTNKVIYLRDNEIATITKNGYVIKNIDGKKIDEKIHKIRWSIDQIQKKGFKHFMLKEIFEQPQSIKNVLRGRIKNNKIKLSVKIDPKKTTRIIIAACGTSYYSGLIGKYIIEKITRIPVEVDYASEFRYRYPIINHHDTVIAISQSGETADTLAAIQEAKNKNANTIGIINTVGSSITREVNSGIYLHAGPEIGVASTKAFTSQIVALVLLSLYIAQLQNKKIDNCFFTELAKIPDKVKLILDSSRVIEALAKKYYKKSDFFYLGRGVNFPVALEGALKLKEISYIHAEGYPAGEMKHGPIALIEPKTPVIFICPEDKNYQKTLSNIEEIKARGGKIIIVTNFKNKKIYSLSREIIHTPKTHNDLTPILSIIPLQLFAYYIADLRKIDVDKPRNLAKSVTVE